MAGFVKVFDSILDSTVWETPQATRLVWITMLVMADRDGFVAASVPGLAKRAGVERAECERALATLSAPDPDSRTKLYDGRRISEIDGGWVLLNYEKYREKASLEERRAKDAERQRRKYEREKAAREALRNGYDVRRNITQETETSREPHVSHATSPNLGHAEAEAKQKQKAAAAASWTDEDQAALDRLDPPDDRPELDSDELTALDVSKAWHDAAAGMASHHMSKWGDDFRLIAESINTFRGVPKAQRRTALKALMLWVWQAPDGPRNRPDRPLKRPTPGHLAKMIASDLQLARESQWVRGTLAERRDHV